MATAVQLASLAKAHKKVKKQKKAAKKLGMGLRDYQRQSKTGKLPVQLELTEIKTRKTRSDKGQKRAQVTDKQTKKSQKRGRPGSFASWDKLAIRGRGNQAAWEKTTDTGSALVIWDKDNKDYTVQVKKGRQQKYRVVNGIFHSRRSALKAVSGEGIDVSGDSTQASPVKTVTRKRATPKKPTQKVSSGKRGRPRKWQSTEEVGWGTTRGRKSIDQKKFGNWKWKTESLPNGDTAFSHSVPRYGEFLMQEHKGNFYIGYKIPGQKTPFGITSEGTLTKSVGSRKTGFATKREALGSMRDFVRSIGANPAKEINVATALVGVGRRRSVRSSTAYKAVERKLEASKKALSRRQAQVRDYRKETEGGLVGKGLAVGSGVVISALLPGSLKKKDGSPMLNRNGRRFVRLGTGIPLAVWGRQIHPLAALFGWAVVGTELVFTALEYSKRDESGSMPEIGAFHEDDEDFFDDNDDEEEDDDDVDFYGPDIDDDDDDDEGDLNGPEDDEELIVLE